MSSLDPRLKLSHGPICRYCGLEIDDEGTALLSSTFVVAVGFDDVVGVDREFGHEDELDEVEDGLGDPDGDAAVIATQSEPSPGSSLARLICYRRSLGWYSSYRRCSRTWVSRQRPRRSSLRQCTSLSGLRL